MERLGINAVGFLEMVKGQDPIDAKGTPALGKAAASVSFTLFANGVAVAGGRSMVKPLGVLTTGEMFMDVRQAFSQISSVYGAVASR